MAFFTIVGLCLVMLCFVSLIVNTSLLYFITQFYQLRNMSVAGLVALSAANDVMLSLLATLLLPSLLAFEWMWKITERTCEIYLVGQFFTATTSKMSLLVITIDRFWAGMYPMSYKTRRHNQFAMVNTAAVWTCGFFFTGLAFQEANWSSKLLNDSFCNFGVRFPTTVARNSIFTVFMDCLVYLLSILLLIKLWKHPRVLTANDKLEKLRVQRQMAITKSVLQVAGVHFILTTIPFAAAVYLALVNDKPSPTSLMIFSCIATTFAIIEAISNAYVYATRLPNFKSIIRAKLKITNKVTVTVTHPVTP